MTGDSTDPAESFPITRELLSFYVFAGSVNRHFDLGRYRYKGNVTTAIEELRVNDTRGNDIVGAMRALRTYALAHGWRRNVQKVALTFVDQTASNRRALEGAFQVFNATSYAHHTYSI